MILRALQDISNRSSKLMPPLTIWSDICLFLLEFSKIYPMRKNILYTYSMFFLLGAPKLGLVPDKVNLRWLVLALILKEKHKMEISANLFGVGGKFCQLERQVTKTTYIHEFDKPIQVVACNLNCQEVISNNSLFMSALGTMGVDCYQIYIQVLHFIVSSSQIVTVKKYSRCVYKFLWTRTITALRYKLSKWSTRLIKHHSVASNFNRFTYYYQLFFPLFNVMSLQDVSNLGSPEILFIWISMLSSGR